VYTKLLSIKIFFFLIGDLTDSVAPGNVLVTQFAEEWEMYKALYTKCQNESGVTHWLDLRGNHGRQGFFCSNLM
jgi:hypothetical protein